MAAPTPVSALVHRSTLVTAGLLLIFFWQNTLSTLFTTMMLAIGVITATPAGILAFNESDFKKLVAFSTLRQVGLMLIILRSTKDNLFLFHLMSHALFKRILFICCGAVLTSNTCGQQESRKVQTNLMLRMTSYSLMCLTGVNLCGIWRTTGF